MALLIRNPSTCKCGDIHVSHCFFSDDFCRPVNELTTLYDVGQDPEAKEVAPADPVPVKEASDKTVTVVESPKDSPAKNSDNGDRDSKPEADQVTDISDETLVEADVESKGEDDPSHVEVIDIVKMSETSGEKEDPDTTNQATELDQGDSEPKSPEKSPEPADQESKPDLPEKSAEAGESETKADAEALDVVKDSEDAPAKEVADDEVAVEDRNKSPEPETQAETAPSSSAEEDKKPDEETKPDSPEPTVKHVDDEPVADSKSEPEIEAVKPNDDVESEEKDGENPEVSPEKVRETEPVKVPTPDPEPAKVNDPTPEPEPVEVKAPSPEPAPAKPPSPEPVKVVVAKKPETPVPEYKGPKAPEILADSALSDQQKFEALSELIQHNAISNKEVVNSVLFLVRPDLPFRSLVSHWHPL